MDAQAMDWAVFHAINGLAWRSPLADDVVVAWARFGPGALTSFVVLGWFLLPGSRSHPNPRRLAFLSIAAAIVALGISQMIGDAWFRERPYTVGNVRLLVPPSSDPSFPSDHTVGAFALAVPFFFDAKARVFAIVTSFGAILMGFARVYVGAHYPGDALGGATLGASTAALLVWTAAVGDRYFPAMWKPLWLAFRVTESARRAVDCGLLAIGALVKRIVPI